MRLQAVSLVVAISVLAAPHIVDARSASPVLTSAVCNNPPIIRSLSNMVAPATAFTTPERRGYAIASVAVDSHGRAIQARLLVRRGNPQLDAATTVALRSSTYEPAQRRCVAVSGTLAVYVTFIPRAISIANPCDHPPLKIVTSVPAFPEERLPKSPVDVPIRVTLNTIGKVVGVHLIKASRLKDLDDIGLGMARGSSYLPAVRNCRPVTESAAFNFHLYRR